jgi:hypothetical protein
MALGEIVVSLLNGPRSSISPPKNTFLLHVGREAVVRSWGRPAWCSIGLVTPCQPAIEAAADGACGYDDVPVDQHHALQPAELQPR